MVWLVHAASKIIAGDFNAASSAQMEITESIAIHVLDARATCAELETGGLCLIKIAIITGENVSTTSLTCFNPYQVCRCMRSAAKSRNGGSTNSNGARSHLNNKTNKQKCGCRCFFFKLTNRCPDLTQTRLVSQLHDHTGSFSPNQTFPLMFCRRVYCRNCR